MANQFRVITPSLDNIQAARAMRSQRSEPKADDGALDALLQLVADDDAFDLTLASATAEAALEKNPNLEKELVRFAMYGKGSAEGVIRIIRILECICPKDRLLDHLISLESISNPRVRSKVTLTIGRLVQNTAWVHAQLQDENPRVRANAIEALWDIRKDWVENLLLEAALDSNNRVVGNAAYALYKLGNNKAIPIIFSLLRHPEKLFRNTGLWVVTQTGDPRFIDSLEFNSTDVEETGKELALRTAAHQHLVRRLRSSRFCGKLVLDVFSFKSIGSSTRVASLCCLSANLDHYFGTPDIGALNFVIEEDGKQVEDFDCQWTAPTPASLMVIVPASLNRNSGLLQKISAQVEEDGAALPVLSYSAASTGVLRERLTRIPIIPVPDSEKASGIRIFSVSPDLTEAVAEGLPLLGEMPGPHHLFLAVDYSCELKTAAAVNKLIRGTKVIVHAVVAEDASDEVLKTFELIAKRTGGTALRSESLESLGSILTSVQARQNSACELSWRSPRKASGDVRIYCSSSSGYGEVVIGQ